jgi:putative SOS response-associated peptidase YedK
MRSRFQLHSSRLELSEWAKVRPNDIPEDHSSDTTSRRELRHLILRFNPHTRTREVVWMRSGLIPSYAHDSTGAELRTEAHAEAITCSSWLRTAFRRRRCLAPATLLIEHGRSPSGADQDCSFAPISNDVFSVAAVWDSWIDDAGHNIETFAILSVLTAPVLRPLFDRMPVVIEPEDHDRWLHSSTRDPFPVDMLKPLTASELGKWRMMPCLGEEFSSALSSASPRPLDRNENLI